MGSTALLHSRSSGERPGATGIWVKNTLVQGPFGIELRRKCRKTECFEGKGTEALPQSFYCTLTALRRMSLIINGAGEGNRTLVSDRHGTWGPRRRSVLPYLGTARKKRTESPASIPTTASKTPSAAEVDSSTTSHGPATASGDCSIR